MTQTEFARYLRMFAPIRGVCEIAGWTRRVPELRTQRQDRRRAPVLLLLHVRLDVHDSFLKKFVW
jgi:hypothetical protein